MTLAWNDPLSTTVGRDTGVDGPLAGSRAVARSVSGEPPESNHTGSARGPRRAGPGPLGQHRLAPLQDSKHDVRRPSPPQPPCRATPIREARGPIAGRNRTEIAGAGHGCQT